MIRLKSFILPAVVQSCWPLAPPRFRSPTIELSLITPQLSATLTYWPDSDVVTVPLV